MTEAVHITDGEQINKCTKTILGNGVSWCIMTAIRTCRILYTLVTKNLPSWKGHICVQITLIISLLSSCWNRSFFKGSSVFTVVLHYSIEENLPRVSLQFWEIDNVMGCLVFSWYCFFSFPSWFNHSICCAPI